MLWTLFAFLCASATVGLSVPIIVHAFRRSGGTGLMVLLIPGYLLMYGFSQFDSPRRPILVPALIFVLVLSGIFTGLAGGALP